MVWVIYLKHDGGFSELKSHNIFSNEKSISWFPSTHHKNIKDKFIMAAFTGQAHISHPSGINDVIVIN